MTKVISFLLFFTGYVVNPAAHAWQNTQPDTAYDCSRVQINELNETELTREERITLLEDNLVESLDDYTRCMEQVQQNMSASGSAGGDLSEGELVDAQGADNSANSDEQQDDQSSPEQTIRHTGGGGADNQKIKHKDNDSIVCRMLRDEVNKETDAGKKADLTQQLKDYNCR